MNRDNELSLDKSVDGDFPNCTSLEIYTFNLLGSKKCFASKAFRKRFKSLTSTLIEYEERDLPQLVDENSLND